VSVLRAVLHLEACIRSRDTFHNPNYAEHTSYQSRKINLTSNFAPPFGRSSRYRRFPSRTISAAPETLLHPAPSRTSSTTSEAISRLIGFYCDAVGFRQSLRVQDRVVGTLKPHLRRGHGPPALSKPLHGTHMPDMRRVCLDSRSCCARLQDQGHRYFT
jgi:hypothetical protein